jgi:competence protein CoiA
MRLALVDDKRIEAQPNQQGICPNCSQSVIAKCGKQKIWHWAHRKITSCDNWWEPETEWHRNWKNNYPLEWQEIQMIDQETGEKHISDVRTIHNLTIEFQHSSIKPDERISREKFYKNMIWVVDGTRLERDYIRFNKGLSYFRSTRKKGFYFVDFPGEVFPKNWLNSEFPVIFDFCGLSTNEQDKIKNILWCLLPKKDSPETIVMGLIKKDFIQKTRNNGRF